MRLATTAEVAPRPTHRNRQFIDWYRYDEPVAGGEQSGTRGRAGELIFVYNADATLTGMLSDFAHRTLRPDTYECNLCDLTYGMMTKKKDWREFVDALPMPASFTLRDRFQKKHPELVDIEFPALFLARPTGDITVLVPAEEMQAAESLDDLERLVGDAVAAHLAR
jgi:hypothetical protein